MAISLRTLTVAFVLAAATSACSHQPPSDLVVVLPEENGHVGGVVARDRQGTTVLLDRAYAAARSQGDDGLTAVPVAEGEVKAAFGQALAALPITPHDFLLYFKNDSDELTETSRRAFDAVFNDIARRAAADIAVTGHTDTMGELTYNDGLALQRARKVKDMLVGRGVPADDVSVAGRGERELLISTGDEVSESRNRRVVVTVR